MNRIFNEDCRKTAARGLSFDYVWTSPPGWAELGLSPGKGDQEYADLMREVFAKLNPRSELVTVLVTDRKYKGRIWPRHLIFHDLMAELGLPLRSYKIWAKTPARNPFRLQFSHVMTFGTGRQYQDSEFMADVFRDVQPIDEPRPPAGTYRNAHPTSLVKKCIRNHTKPGDLVFDPFMGTGSVAVAAIQTGRSFIGSEIDPATYAIALNRIDAFASSPELNF